MVFNMTVENNIIKVNSTKFGDLEINKELVFDFVCPIIGFDDLTKYALIDYKPDSPFKWLQSIEEADLAFPVTLCSFFNIDYQFDIPDEEAAKLEIENADDILVCNIANIPASNPHEATINMLAPVVINLQNKKAMQLILKNTDFEVRYKLFKEEDTEQE